MEAWLTPAGDDDTSNNRNESEISKPSLPLEGNEIGEDGSEERGGGTNGLIERDGEKAKRDVTANNRGTKDEAECGDLEELDSRSDGLHRDHLQPGNGDVTE